MMEAAGLRNVTARSQRLHETREPPGALFGGASHGWYIVGQGMK
jgi:hypothetical protein